MDTPMHGSMGAKDSHPPRLLRLVAAAVTALIPRSRPWFVWLKFRIYGQRIDRNQWAEGAMPVSPYFRFNDLTWEQTRQEFPDYFMLLEAAVSQARGRVLEIGCGTGTMTRWLANSPAVQSILAVEGFEDGLKQLRDAAMQKVTTLCAQADKLQLPSGSRFDTVVMTELIEHLYPDEEAALLKSIRPHLAPAARFIVSTPIGWMADRFHVRGFSKSAFSRHLARFYGKVEFVDYSSGYSQLAAGTFSAS